MQCNYFAVINVFGAKHDQMRFKESLYFDLKLAGFQTAQISKQIVKLGDFVIHLSQIRNFD